MYLECTAEMRKPLSDAQEPETVGLFAIRYRLGIESNTFVFDGDDEGILVSIPELEPSLCDSGVFGHVEQKLSGGFEDQHSHIFPLRADVRIDRERHLESVSIPHPPRKPCQAGAEAPLVQYRRRELHGE